MPGVPSNKACDRCKKRHVKCDEGRPGCTRCATAGVDCPGYSQDRKFIDQGATVRRRYAPYSKDDTRGQPSDRRLATEEQDKEEVPSQSRSHHSSATPGSLESMPLESDNQINRSNSDYFGLASGNQPPLQPQTNSVATAPYADLTASADFLNAPQSIRDAPNTESLTFANPFDPFNSMQSPRLYNRDLENQAGLGSTVTPNFSFINSPYPTARNANPLGDLYSELMINSERETGFLSRHYVEFIAPWLDLHDSDRFFAQAIPRRSFLVPFIQYSISAIAAKHLARINGAKSLRDSTSRPATTETYPNVTGVNWQFKATNYYCQALLHMRQLVLGHADPQQLDTAPSPIQLLCRDLGINMTSENAGPAIMPPTFVSNIDDIYPGLVILTIFDILDQPGTEWETRFLGLGHLLKCLLSFTGPQNRTLMVSPALRASFWNFAYLECFASYATRRRTRLDAFNFDLFRAAGISLDNQGLLDLYGSGDSQSFSQRDDMFFRGVTFIILKLVNFIAEFKEIQEAANTEASPVPDFLSNSSVPQSSGLAVKWHQLLQEVDGWHNSLPDTFQPYIHLENPHDFLSATSTSSPSLPFPEIVFSNATHASAMALYNYARIVLLLNRPYESQHTPRDRLVNYREITKQVDSCTREIAGIAMGRTAAVVQIHLVQLLYVVGLCDDRPEARTKVVELLRAVREEHGWETEYKIAQLQTMWNKE